MVTMGVRDFNQRYQSTRDDNRENFKNFCAKHMPRASVKKNGNELQNGRFTTYRLEGGGGLIP